MMKNISFALLVVQLFTLTARQALAGCDYVAAGASALDRPYSPVVQGQAHVEGHPHYQRLLAVACSLGVRVEWVSNVAKATGMKLRPGETIEGYFDDVRNLVFLDRRIASLATVVHELRHALHLGLNHPVVGGGFEREIQLAVREGKRLEAEVKTRADLTETERKKLIGLKEKLVVNASEIASHYHDLLILLRRHAHAQAKASAHYRKLYRRQFDYAYEKLESMGAIEQYPFLKKLAEDLDRYYAVTSRILREIKNGTSINNPEAMIQSTGSQ